MNSDDRFYYIAGYTSGGAPYGITWEEMDANFYEDEVEFDINEDSVNEEDDDMPF
ncbi:hypothetical protein RBH29_06850 [Herbivorax sp. ANBcel31]|uniref:hypothetical protein n=1 Tax=Herbivorax sp. ANBcel31 TaxID=3069754 RepID=UPI0027B68804|nr:hypothetical protein [Herbivorax sp. ANBcel31]MDQ2086148.1 hypothetical protein [Herbivorax sp. ANBcel31]